MLDFTDIAKQNEIYYKSKEYRDKLEKEFEEVEKAVLSGEYWLVDRWRELGLIFEAERFI